MQISDKGLALIREFEGCVLHVYNDTAGKPTIGIGHLIRPGEDFSGGITEAQAIDLLRKDVSLAVLAVNAYVKVPINQNQFDALCSFTYNLGAGSLRGSTLLALLNAGKMDDAANEFPKWARAGGQVSSGLLRRRQAERSLFLEAA